MDTNPARTQQASRGRDAPVVTGLVTRARNGELQAWDALVDRYAPLIWSICRRNRLEAADAQDVWLKLVGQLDKIRDPTALPGWPSPPGANAAAYALRGAAALRRRACARRRGHPGRSRPGSRAGPARHRTARSPAGGVRAATPGLQAAARAAHRRSCALVCRDQRQAGIPAGSVGPTRRHCLDELRRHPAITALINPDT